MKYIKKVIFSDDTEIIQDDIKPFVDVKGEGSWQRIERLRNHKNKFKKFEYEVLSSLYQGFVEEYSKSNFDLIEEGECDCEEQKNLSDFSDNELFKELRRRNIFDLKQNDIISSDLLIRFKKIIENGDLINLGEVIEELEKKYRLI